MKSEQVSQFVNGNDRMLQFQGQKDQLGSAIVSGNSTSVQALQNELNKQLMVYLSKVQVGDLLKGQLISEDGQTMLRLPNGMKLLANCLDPAVSEKLQEFIVTGKSRQHLELQLKDGLDLSQGTATNLVEQAVKEIGLDDQPLTKEAMAKFMAKQLPLAKQQLAQVLQFAKCLEIPTEATTNLLSNHQLLSHEEGKMIASYKANGGEGISQQLGDILKGVPGEAKEALIDVLKQSFTSKEIITFLEREGQLKGDEKAQMGDLQPTEQEAFIQPEKKAAIASGQETSHFKGSEFLKQLGEEQLLSKFFEGKAAQDIKDILKGMVKERLTVTIDTLSDEKEIEKLDKAAEMIKKVTARLKEAEMQGVDQNKLEQLEKMGEAIQKYNTEAQYFCFPMQINGKEAEGELYFFKPKKKKKDGSSGMYIVLALNMPHLNKVEVHLKENVNKVDLRLRVKEKGIKELVEQHSRQLHELLEDTAFELGSMSCELIEETKEQIASISPYDALARLDARI